MFEKEQTVEVPKAARLRKVEEGGGRGLRGIVPVRQRLSSALDQLGQSDAVAVDVREGADRGGAEGGEVDAGLGMRRS